MEKITEYLIKPTLSEKGIVKVWKETIKLPTYEIGEEEKNPIFLEKRVYQGSSGVVYPYPVVEKICDEKKEKDYQAYFLENEYLKIMILPELGGRVQMAYDKVKKRHFVYYNQVIKPALVGLTGPWISGGIEFNWPQHHRPSTYLPTDCMIEENADGSKTVWCNEVERMFNTKGMQGFTLHPDKAYLEELLTVLNLKDRRKHLPSQLSGGQQQRVAIGRALMTRPSLILADEPTGNLDTQNSSEVIALLKETSRKYEQTILMITHNRSIAQTADRVLQVSDGCLTDFGRCRE